MKIVFVYCFCCTRVENPIEIQHANTKVSFTYLDNLLGDENGEPEMPPEGSMVAMCYGLPTSRGTTRGTSASARWGKPPCPAPPSKRGHLMVGACLAPGQAKSKVATILYCNSQ